MTRVGRQTPTQSVILPYSETKGNEAIKLYAMTGNELMEWQQLMLCDIMAVNADGLWTHSKFGYSVPRRNGKTEVVTSRELWGLFNGEHILHTAQLTDTAHIAWERLLNRIENLGIHPVSVLKAFGKEHIELDTGGVIEFRTRTTTGGLGSGYDLVVIDEAQEYTIGQQTALNYVVSAQKNPQTIMLGTPPTTESAGTVFKNLRKKVLSGDSDHTGWSEWSVPKMSNVHDKDLWYETSPSLGTLLTERAIMDEINGDDMDFNIQRLGLWLEYNLQSAISQAEWDELKVDKLPQLTGQLTVGIKYGKGTGNIAVSIAVKTTDGKVFVESLACKPFRFGQSWLIHFLEKADVDEVIVDGANGVETLKKDMKDDGLHAPIYPKVAEIITANVEFEKAVTGKMICHRCQPSLAQSVTNSEHRAIGSNGGFGYKSLNDQIDVSLMESMILAFYFCTQRKDKKKRIVSY